MDHMPKVEVKSPSSFLKNSKSKSPLKKVTLFRTKSKAQTKFKSIPDRFKQNQKLIKFRVCKLLKLTSGKVYFSYVESSESSHTASSKVKIA